MLNYNAKDNHLAAAPRGSSPTWCVHECTFPHSHSLYSRERTKTASDHIPNCLRTLCFGSRITQESNTKLGTHSEMVTIIDGCGWRPLLTTYFQKYTRRRILLLHSRIILNKGVSILQDIRLDLSLRGFKYPCSTMALLLQPMLLLYMCRVLLAVTTSFQGIGRLYLRVQHTCAYLVLAPVCLGYRGDPCADVLRMKPNMLEMWWHARSLSTCTNPGGIFQCSIFPV